jgi:hypothetical protein
LAFVALGVACVPVVALGSAVTSGASVASVVGSAVASVVASALPLGADTVMSPGLQAARDSAASRRTAADLCDEVMRRRVGGPAKGSLKASGGGPQVSGSVTWTCAEQALTPATADPS